MTRRLLPITLLVAALAAPRRRLRGRAASAAREGRHGPLGNERLSNERTLTRWAHTNLLGEHPLQAGARRPGRSPSCAGTPRTACPRSTSCWSRGSTTTERVWLKIRIPGRPNGRTGWVREEQLSNLKVDRDAPHDRPRQAPGDAAQARQEDLVARRRRRRAGHGHAEGPLLDPRAALQPRRQPDLRPLGVRHLGVLRHADRLAGRRRRGHPRHQPARAHPGPPVARLRARPERGRSPARADHADRHADPDQVAPAGLRCLPRSGRPSSAR